MNAIPYYRNMYDYIPFVCYLYKLTLLSFSFHMFLHCFSPWPYLPNVWTCIRKNADNFSIAINVFCNLFWKICPLFGQILITVWSVAGPPFCLPLIAKKWAGNEVSVWNHLWGTEGLLQVPSQLSDNSLLKTLFERSIVWFYLIIIPLYDCYVVTFCIWSLYFVYQKDKQTNK